MKPVLWSMGATSVATTVLFVAIAQGADGDLRWAGACCGGALALVGALFGIQRSAVARRASSGDPAPARFFLEQRHAARHAVDLPVRVRAGGTLRGARLVSVSARGALLRFEPGPGEKLALRVGDPVSIEDYPAGTITRVGSHGVCVDFAIAFDQPTAAASAAARS